MLGGRGGVTIDFASSSITIRNRNEGWCQEEAKEEEVKEKNCNLEKGLGEKNGGRRNLKTGFKDGKDRKEAEGV